jgi:hypothetical protein
MINFTPLPLYLRGKIPRYPLHRRLGGALPHAFTLVSCSAYSTLKMETICSSETSVDFQRTTRRYITEDSILFLTTAVRISNPARLVIVACPTFLWTVHRIDQCRISIVCSVFRRFISVVPRHFCSTSSSSCLTDWLTINYKASLELTHYRPRSAPASSLTRLSGGGFECYRRMLGPYSCKVNNVLDVGYTLEVNRHAAVQYLTSYWTYIVVVVIKWKMLIITC